jgi:hypothetical protein
MWVMKNLTRSLVIVGLSAGIVLLFVGGILNTVFPSSETDFTAYRVSASIKLFGIGGLICTMLVAGIRLEGMDRTLRLLILILGLVMLVIYTAGSSFLEWNVPSYAHGNYTAYDYRPTGMGIPGFETGMMLVALLVVVAGVSWRRRG